MPLGPDVLVLPPRVCRDRRRGALRVPAGVRRGPRSSQFSRGLAAALVAAADRRWVLRPRAPLAGYVIDDSDRRGGSVAVAAVATVPAALAFLPVYVPFRAARRPAPLRHPAHSLQRSRRNRCPVPRHRIGLAGPRAGSRGRRSWAGRDDVPTHGAIRPGLRDRVYTWAEPRAQAGPGRRGRRSGTERSGSARIAVRPRLRSRACSVQRQHLLEDIADSLGAVLPGQPRRGSNSERQLRAALAYAGEIAVSRRAVVAEMDGERRRIERDLHDGAQHHLVSLRLTLGLVEHQVSTAQFDQARDSARTRSPSQIDVAESILAETAEGVSSPLLATVGLVGALRLELEAGQHADHRRRRRRRRAAPHPARRRVRGVLLLPGGCEQRAQAHPGRGDLGAVEHLRGPIAVRRPRRGPRAGTPLSALDRRGGVCAT